MTLALAMLLSVGLVAIPDGAEEPSGPLKIGDKAPLLKLTHWIPETPPASPGVASATSNPVMVVHFGSVWNDEYRADMARITQLAVRWSHDDLVVMSISNDDPSQLSEIAATVKDFPQFLGRDAENRSSDIWLNGVEDFPYHFVVGRDGRIVWHGKSITLLQDVVLRSIDGTFDPDAEKARRELFAEKSPPLMNELEASLQRGDAEQAMNVIDKVIAIDPKRLESYGLKRLLMRRFEQQGLMSDVYEEMRAANWDSVAGLMQIVEWGWLERSVAARDPWVMWRSAQRVVELTNGSDPFALEELARMDHELGRHDEAVAHQRDAAGKVLMDSDSHMATTLEYYVRCRDAAALAAGKIAASQPATSQPVGESGKAAAEDAAQGGDGKVDDGKAEDTGKKVEENPAAKPVVEPHPV